MNRRPILHVTDDYSPANTGVTAALEQLVRFLEGAGVPTKVLAVGGSSGSSTTTLTTPLSVPPWRFAAGFRKMIRRENQVGIIHLHGVWMYPQWAASRLAIERDIPFVISPHNMLGGWLWRRGALRRLKKRLYWEIMIKALVRQAAVIHALSRHERDVLRRDFFPDGRIEVIPNGISLAEIDNSALLPEQLDEREQRFLLFLGRLHPVKGLERLLDAYAHYEIEERLVIAGPCESEGYLSQLNTRAQRLGIHARVKFLGSVQGPEKWRLIRNAWVVCSPSFSEGMSMVTLEAMAARTPVIASSETAIPQWKESGGVVFEDDAAGLGRVLRDVTSWSLSERRARGQAARRVVENNYDWNVIGPRYLDMYRSLLA